MYDIFKPTIKFPEYTPMFHSSINRMSYNYSNHSSTWIIHGCSVNAACCFHVHIIHITFKIRMMWIINFYNFSDHSPYDTIYISDKPLYDYQHSKGRYIKSKLLFTNYFVTMCNIIMLYNGYHYIIHMLNHFT